MANVNEAKSKRNHLSDTDVGKDSSPATSSLMTKVSPSKGRKGLK